MQPLRQQRSFQVKVTVAALRRRRVYARGSISRTPAVRSGLVARVMLAGVRSWAMPLNHVALTVSDRVRSAAFYGEQFGLTERLQEDDHLLILGSDDGSELAF